MASVAGDDPTNIHQSQHTADLGHDQFVKTETGFRSGSCETVCVVCETETGFANPVKLDR